MIIGITGGTGCGKTTALQVFSHLGGTVIDCDAVYHQLLQADKGLLCAIDTRFPGVVKEGVLDRKALGAVVFSNTDALAELNRITHAAVIKEVQKRLTAPGHIAIDAIALLESGLGALCDVTVAVTAPAEMRIQRIMARDSISEDYARQRIAAQKSESYFRTNCDHILENNGTETEFHAKCLAFFKGLGIMEEESFPIKEDIV